MPRFVFDLQFEAECADLDEAVRLFEDGKWLEWELINSWIEEDF